MRRRQFLIAIAGGVFLPEARVQAQESSKRARVGYVTLGGPSEGFDGLQKGLAQKGYIEGRNLVFTGRFAEGHSDRLPGIVAELLALPVDVLVAIGTPTALVAQHQTRTVPIVFMSGDPVGVGLVASLARPGGNLTGVSLLSFEYGTKWLELLKETQQQLHSVAVLWNPDNPASVELVERMRQAAPRFGLDFAAFSSRPNDIDASLAAIAVAGADGLVITDDGSLNALGPRLAAFAAERRMLAISGFGYQARQGVLMAYSVDFFSMGQRMASYVDRLLKGARPAALPVEQAIEFKLRINLKAAKALGLTIPPALLARADEVIE